MTPGCLSAMFDARNDEIESQNRAVDQPSSPLSSASEADMEWGDWSDLTALSKAADHRG